MKKQHQWQDMDRPLHERMSLWAIQHFDENGVRNMRMQQYAMEVQQMEQEIERLYERNNLLEMMNDDFREMLF